MFWYNEDDVWEVQPQENEPINAVRRHMVRPDCVPEGQLSFNKKVSVTFCDKSPRWADFELVNLCHFIFFFFFDNFIQMFH